MKKFVMIVLSVICTILWMGCGKYFSFSRSNKLALTDNSLVIDKGYELYVRETYKSGGVNDKQMRTNFSGASLNKKELIEVEYLLLSKKKKNVLYFSTIPDKWQRYYARHYPGPNMVNCYDLRVLYTGKLDEADGLKVLYMSKDTKFTDAWEITFNADKSIVTLNSIIERHNGEFIDYLLVDEALSDPIRFVKSDSLQMVYIDPDNKKPDTARLLGNRMYFKKAKNKRKYEVYFRFDRPLKDGYTDILFKDKRLFYSPAPLF